MVKSSLNPVARETDVLMWDLAGTLIPVDPQTGHHCVLPGARNVLPALKRDFRQVVTTGDSTADARNTLRDFQLLDFFEEVFGGLGQPVGKPHGAVLARLRALPDHSLVIGDRLNADIAADTDQLVTILVNQGQDLIDADMVPLFIQVLRDQKRDNFAAAFDALTQSAEPHPRPDFISGGGDITGSWRRDDGVGYRLWNYSPPMLSV